MVVSVPPQNDTPTLSLRIQNYIPPFFGVQIGRQYLVVNFGEKKCEIGKWYGNRIWKTPGFFGVLDNIVRNQDIMKLNWI